MLAGVLRDHRGPLSADLRRYYHCSLGEALSGQVGTLEEVAAWVYSLPSDSAVSRAANPEGAWQYDQALELRRQTLWELQQLNYLTSKRYGGKPEKPKIYVFPWEQDPDDEAIRGDAMTVEDADDWLGWTAEMKDYLQRGE